jgi:hypothetical protein
MKEFHPEKGSMKDQGVHGLDNRICQKRKKPKFIKDKTRKKCILKKKDQD